MSLTEQQIVARVQKFDREYQGQRVTWRSVKERNRHTQMLLMLYTIAYEEGWSNGRTQP